MKETELAEFFKKKLRQEFPSHYYYKVRDSKGTTGKLPFDAFTVIYGKFFALEYKIEPRELTVYQHWQFKKVRTARGHTLKVTNENWRNCLKIINALLMEEELI